MLEGEGPALLVGPLFPGGSWECFSGREPESFLNLFPRKRLDCLGFDVCGLRIDHFLSYCVPGRPSSSPRPPLFPISTPQEPLRGPF